MNLRDLVVLLDGSRRDEVKLQIAIGLARRYDAHLTGLCPMELLLPPDMSFALGGYPDLWAMPEFARQMEAQARGKAEVIEAGFRDTLRREGVTGDWQFDAGSLIPVVVARARTAGLMVIGQSDPANPPPAVARTLIEDVMMMAGRPLLLVPYAGRFERLGSDVLVGWTDTRESARAAHDALAIMEPGARVTVLTVEPAGHASGSDTVPTADIAEHLSRYGLQVAAARTVTSPGLSAADALLDYASDISADLLVLGGYGHSRTREMILGGVTRDILRHMTVPVLMSH